MAPAFVAAPARREQALVSLSAEFPGVPAQFRVAVLSAYLTTGRSVAGALEAARHRITDALAQ